MKRWPGIRHIRYYLAWFDVALLLMAIGRACWEEWFPGDLDKMEDIRTGRE